MFKTYSDDTLITTRNSLLSGLARVGESLVDGTFHQVGENGKAPPSQSGQLTLTLLVQINNELVERGYKTVFVG